MNKEPESKVRIQFEHCDPFGHLNNMQYLSYIMTARTNHLRDEYQFDLFEHGNRTGNNWVVSRTRINYMAPIKYNEIATIQTRLIHVDDRKIIPEAIVYNADKTKLHAIAWIEFTYFNVNRARPLRHESELLDFLKSIALPLDEFHLEKLDLRISEIRKSLGRSLQMVDV
ncbi:acyl-CoA thioesterase [Leptospira ognonensis]|uniref:Acyl-CoA thioesterase n=1 Tax=Leptospira ognonensis TaxID=2484945 RepID=A0A4R9K0Y4_9LEPT|nr:acyl-CoA thioesterase [Leptospira ognonensis]TGL59329.1 acyl-CoA thioesterase [Leptospira ognonensis]